VEKAPDSDVLRDMIGFAAERPMELEVDVPTGAAHGEKSRGRLAQRNDYRDRDGRRALAPSGHERLAASYGKRPAERLPLNCRPSLPCRRPGLLLTSPEAQDRRLALSFQQAELPDNAIAILDVHSLRLCEQVQHPPSLNDLVTIALQIRDDSGLIVDL